MRKTFFTLSLLAASLTAAAQYEKNDIIITPMAGASIAWMAPNATSSGDEYSAKAGLVAGVEAEYMLSRSLGISAGLAYSQMGRKKTERKYDYTEKIDYLNIPLMVNYHVCKGLVVKAGIQPCVRLNAKWGGGEFIVKRPVTFPETYEKIPYGNPDDVTLTVHENISFNKYTNTMVVALPIGLSYEYHGFVIDARYVLSLGNTFKNTVAYDYIEEGSRHMRFYVVNSNAKNRNVQITLGYRFKL